MAKTDSSIVEDYIAAQPGTVRTILKRVRAIISGFCGREAANHAWTAPRRGSTTKG